VLPINLGAPKYPMKVALLQSSLHRRWLIALFAWAAPLSPAAWGTPLTIVAQPLGQTATAGSKVTFAVSATGAEPLKYHWTVNGADLGNINYNPTFSIADVQKSDEATYQVKVTDRDGLHSVVSDPATLNVVDAAPTITQPLRSETFYRGSFATIVVEAIGTAPRIYHWFKNSEEIASGIWPQIQFDRLKQTDAGVYTVVVTNSLGSATSVGTIAVNLAPPFAGGSGTPTDPYQISTAAQLEGIRTMLTKSYTLVSDIDLSGATFRPLGSPLRPFEGNFEGNGHSIQNWTYIDPTAQQEIGFFSVIAASGKVSNLRMTNCNIEAGAAGILAGVNYGKIENCSTTGSVKGQTAGGLAAANAYELYVGPPDRGWIIACHSDTLISDNGSTEGPGEHGGLVAHNESRIQDCYATGTVLAPQPRWAPAGGLVGVNNGPIDRSFATGVVVGSSRVGGLVGYSQATINACSASGAVSGADQLGALVGASYAMISNSYATGGVSGNLKVGGLVGYLEMYGMVGESYSTGLVFGDVNIGGLVGSLDGVSAVVNSYWNTDLSGQTSSAGGLGKTTAEMNAQSAYPAWNFQNVWTILPGQFPTLRPSAPLVPFIITRPSYLQIALNRPLVLSVEVSGSPPFTYQWKHAGSDIPDAVGPSLAIASAAYSDGGEYTVVVSNVAGTDVSDSFYVGVHTPTNLGPPVLTAQPQNLIVREGDPAGFSTDIDYTVTSTYQWYFNGAAVLLVGDTHGMITQAVDGRSLTIRSAAAENQGTYYVVATNSEGSTTSASATLTVIPEGFPEITAQPEGTGVISGDTLTLSGTATGNPPLTYQWRRNGIDLTGATSPTLTLTNVNVALAGAYTLVVTSPQGSLISAVATVSVQPPVIGTLSPQGITAGSGDFNLTVSGDFFRVGAMVRWNGVGRFTTYLDSATLGAAIPASDVAAAASISTNLVTVQSVSGDISSAKALTVLPMADVPFKSDTTVVDSTVTVSTANVGSSAMVTATLQNNTLGSGDAAITVANYSASPVPAPSFDVGGGYVDVQATGVDVSDTVATSFYYPSTVTGSTEVDLELRYYNGSTWQPVLSGGGATPSKNTTDNLDGTVSGGRFSVVFDNTSTPKITELTGTVFTATINRDTVPPTVQSITPSVSLLLPADHTMRAVTMSVIATDNRDPHPLSRILAVTSNEPVVGKRAGQTDPDWQITGDLTVSLRAERSNVGEGRIYTITIVTSDYSGNVVTNTATVVVPKDKDADRDPPRITNQPVDQKILLGSNVVLSAGVAPALPVTYQWRFNDVVIPSATEDTLTVPGVTMAQAGQYRVTITNRVGSTTSRVAKVVVIPHGP
jgi:hypothetical protein